MAKMSKEARQRLSDAAKARWANQRAAAAEADTLTEEAPVAAPEPVTEKQCVYCGARFDSDILAEHQRLMHKGDMPTEEPELPAFAKSLAPGSIVRSVNSDGTVGIPMKTPWSKKMLEEGWECDDPGDRVMEEGGWRYIPEKDAELPPRCQRCGGPMHKLSNMVEWDAPENGPSCVPFQGLLYWIHRGEINKLPDVIVGQARASMAEDRANRVPPSSQAGEGNIGRLATVGFISDDE